MDSSTDEEYDNFEVQIEKGITGNGNSTDINDKENNTSTENDIDKKDGNNANSKSAENLASRNGEDVADKKEVDLNPESPTEKKLTEDSDCLLDSDDDLNLTEEEDNLEGGNFLICQHDKVSRIKHKYTLQLRNGIVRVKDREYVFFKASGILEW